MSKRAGAVLVGVGTVAVMIACRTGAGERARGAVRSRSLEERVEALEEVTAELVQRVERLEKTMEEAAGIARSVPVGKAVWRQLKIGMTKDEVRRLMGEPGSVFTLSRGSFTWYYPNRAGGKVNFSTEKVHGWSEP